MLLAKLLIFAGIITAASGQFIIGALALIEFTIEFLEAAEVVATLDATVDIGITAEAAEGGEVLLETEETATSGAARIRSEPVQEVAHSVSGELNLDPVTSGSTSATGRFTLDVEPFVLNPSNASPHVRVEVDFASDISITGAGHGPGSSSNVGFSMSNLRLGKPSYSGYGGRGEFNWRVRQSGGKFLSSK